MNASSGEEENRKQGEKQCTWEKNKLGQRNNGLSTVINKIPCIINVISKTHRKVVAD